MNRLSGTMRETTLPGYELLSQIYRQLLEPRGFFTNQYYVIMELFSIYGLGKQTRILDAACGTGDIAVRLSKESYSVIGVDGSPHQLSQWPEDGESVARICCRWEAIREVFDSHESFNVVYILGHSLPHLHPNSLPFFFERVHKGLAPNGLFVFDLRSWESNENGSHYETGRESGVKRYLGNVHIGNNQFRVFDTVKYVESAQLVTYSLHSTTKNQLKLEETLLYHIYHWSDAVRYLEAAGFERNHIEVFQLPKWPYLLVCCQKQS